MMLFDCRFRAAAIGSMYKFFISKRVFNQQISVMVHTYAADAYLYGELCCKPTKHISHNDDVMEWDTEKTIRLITYSVAGN